MFALDDLGGFGDSVDGGQNPMLPSGYDTIFSVVLVVIVLAAVVIVVLAVLRALRLRKAGINPLSTEGELMAHVLRGDLPATPPPGAAAASAMTVAFGQASSATGASPTSTGGRPLEVRLAELDDLARRGVISADEHATARRDLLSHG
ncbi:hypothetical protein GCM10025864_27320 [Luteimicrobium album]|uniref:SHOCT domain-containing protein n=1 Tax=Luteimicrobium album TaxID=1054550 RepID=A0ABQ6I2H1_9MICO|nr:hypothetical protein [Luteimicrobium album]GMA24973.1 hypothetical protein GCM10025864_27320 [Luteimicrobium album]